MAATEPPPETGNDVSGQEAHPSFAHLSSTKAGASAFLVAGATLSLQILMHRIVSAKLLNNYAFLVISLTMLGFAISGVVLTLLQERIQKRLADSLLIGSCLMAISAVAGISLFATSMTVAGAGVTRVALVKSFMAWTPYALLLTVPFAFAGTMLGALLSDERLPTRRVYFFDLVGSAVGSLVILPLLRFASVEALIPGMAMVLVAGIGLIVRPRSARLRGLLALVFLALLVVFQQRNEVFSIYFPEGSMLARTRDPKLRYVLEYTQWDPLARIEVSSVPGAAPITGRLASLFGENRAFLARYKKLITQNNYAFTYAVDYDGRPESLTGIEETIYASAYYASPVLRPKVAVIGVGGGFDILTALRFDASKVTAIEINAATVDILTNVYKDYFHHWVSDPRVTLANADGRHHLSTTRETFDVIQLSGVDSYSGTPGAAHVFSENYLYTAEAFDLYLHRLTDDGVINMMRFEHHPEREMLRALTTAVAALRRLGVDNPRDHIVTLTERSGEFTALLVKRRPFKVAELARLQAWAAARPSFAISAEPGPLRARPTNAYQAFLGLGQARLERIFINEYPFDIAPSTDDKPFFFNFSFWWHLFPENPAIWAEVPVLQTSLVFLSALVVLVAVAAVLLPLAVLLHRGASAGRHRVRLATYFSFAAFGYLAIEIALMQQFGLFLGHPNFAISVVLAALLLFTGIGSLFADSIVRRLSNLRFVAFLLAFVIFGEFFFAFPNLPSILGLPFGWRAAITAVLILPIGLCLGVFLPTGIEWMKRVSPDLVPWAWGVNGVFSVLSPLVAVAISTTLGISALLLCAVPAYLVVSFSLPESA